MRPDDADREIERLRAEVERLAEENAVLRRALSPFAKVLGRQTLGASARAEIDPYGITIGMLRRARSALERP